MADHEEDLEEGAEAEDRTSLTYKMAHPEEAPGFVASNDDEETPEAKAAREAAEAEAAAAAAGGGDEETPEAKAAREAAEAEADKTKDWTLEDFKKGYKESETRMHTATGETAKEKTAREAAEKRAEVAEQKAADLEAEKERLTAEAAEAARPKPLSEEEQDAIFAKAAEELRDLDNTDPNYLLNYGRIWRKAMTAAGLNRTPADPELTADEVANKAWEKFQAKSAAEAAKTVETRERETQERLNQEANDFAKQSGLDMTPGSADYRLFWDIANNDLGEQEFMKGDTPASKEEQFKWVTEETKKLRGTVVDQTDAERAAALAAQKNNSVMGRGVSFVPQGPPKKRSLSEMQEERASSGRM